MKKLLIKSYIVVLTCGVAFSANAAVSETVFQQSLSYLNDRKPSAAFELLRDQNKSSAQDWFLFGTAAQQSGHMSEAQAAFKMAIQLDPQNSGRIKLELASVSYALGNSSAASQLLNEVKAENPPSAVRQNIDRFLSIIGDEQCRTSGNQRWCVNGQASVMYDSNVNNATTADQVMMYGLPFTLSADAKAQSDFAYTLSATLDHIAVLSEKAAWQSNFDVRWTDYTRLNQFDTLQISASTGPVLQLDEKTRLSVPVTANTIAYTDKGKFDSVSVGIAPQLRRQLNEKVALNLGSNLNSRHYIDNATRDTLSYSFSPGLDISACNNGTLRLGASVGRDDAQTDTNSNNNWGLNTSLYCLLTPEIAMSLYGGYSESRYDAREAAYSVNRHDKKATVGANVRYAKKGNGLSGEVGINYTNNDSNLVLYKYQKVQVNASVKKKF